MGTKGEDKHFLIIDDRAEIIAHQLKTIYSDDKCEFHQCNNFDINDVIEALNKKPEISVILLDIYDTNESSQDTENPAGMRLLKSIDGSTTFKERMKTVLIVVLTGDPHIITHLDASKLQLERYIEKTALGNKDDPKTNLVAIWNQSQVIRKLNLVPKHFKKCEFIYDINNPEIKAIFENIRKVAGFDDVPILIRGDTGTGKDLLAKAISEEIKASKKTRKGVGDFKALNIASVPPNLLHSELFGYLPKSFSGASDSGKIGVIQNAHLHNATLFLDEIGDASLDIQASLLRVLQNHEIFPLGAHEHGCVGWNKSDNGTFIPNDIFRAGEIVDNILFIFATNKSLEDLIKKRKFREDFFYRINVFPINNPPLKERRTCIPLLAEHFRQKFNKEYKNELKFPDYSDFMKKLQHYDWPGNVRELEHDILRSFILSSEYPDKTIKLAKDVEEKLSGKKSNDSTNVQNINNLYSQLINDPMPLSAIAKDHGVPLAIELGKKLMREQKDLPGDETAHKYFKMNYNSFKKWMHSKGVTLESLGIRRHKKKKSNK